ncbi:MAG: hypothetical protein RLZZ182_330, partial [Pseudomonadota bacterium]
MSVLLMGAVKAFVREQFTAQQVLTVDYYGGEFSAEEVAFSGQPVPAVLIAGLGWTPPRGNERMVGNTVRVCHMAAFVVTKDGGRAERMLAAQALAEQLDLALTMWRPADQAGPLEVVGPEPGVRAENVYNRKIDAKGLALWL